MLRPWMIPALMTRRAPSGLWLPEYLQAGKSRTTERACYAWATVPSVPGIDVPLSYIERTGSTPATAAAQSVGWIRDIGQGTALGAALLSPESGYSTIPSGVSGAGSPQTTEVTSQEVRITIAGAVIAAVRLEVSFSCTAGTSYVITGTSNSNFGAVIAGPVNLSHQSVSVGAGVLPFRLVALATSTGTATVRLYPRTISGASQQVNDFCGFTHFSVREIPGTPLVAATDAARPVLEVGPSGGLMIRGDGSSKALQSASAIDGSGFNQVEVIAGYEALGAVNGFLIESSGSASATNGAFSLYRSSTGAYTVQSRGTTNRFVESAAFAAPDVAMLRINAQIAASIADLFRNGLSVASNALSQGTGNYGNHILYLLARAGTSLFANGRLAYVQMLFSNAGHEMTPAEVANSTAFAQRLTLGT